MCPHFRVCNVRLLMAMQSLPEQNVITCSHFILEFRNSTVFSSLPPHQYTVHTYYIPALPHIFASHTNTYMCTHMTYTHIHRTLQQAVVGCGSSFEPFITSDLLQLIFSALKHTNRFIRETGFKVLAAIVKCPGKLCS